MYEASDAEAVVRLHLEQEARLGREFDLPNLLSEPVLAAVVGETDGVITHCVFLEAEVEACALANAPLPTHELDGALELLTPVVQKYNIGMVRAFVPRGLVKVGQRGRKAPITRILEHAGFTQDNDSLVQFFRRMSA